jgi:hypothetical protein
MRLTWPQHLEVSRTVERAPLEQRGEALALMGMSLLIFAQDLLHDDLSQAQAAPRDPAGHR